MKQIIIELTDQEYKAFEYVANTPEAWAENAVKNRARQAIDEVTERALIKGDDSVNIDKEDIPKEGVPMFFRKAKNIPKEVKDKIVEKATLKTAKQRNEEAEQKT
jgi:hypothetical protein